jgi:negative regulator of flagellin synthesis FlgM
MDIRTSLNGLGQLFGVTPASTSSAAQAQGQSHAASASNGFDSDKATLSTAGNEVSQSAADSDVRTGKVAEIQAALANGTYNVPASAVASKLVDAMLNGGN